MKKILLFIYAIATAFQGNTQAITFSKVYSNFDLNSETAADIHEVSDGYLIVASKDCSAQNSNTCFSLTKLTKAGDIAWVKEYDFYAAFRDGLRIYNDLIYISGHTHYPDEQFVLCCMDLQGDILWRKEYGQPNKHEAFPRIAISNDHIFLYGSRDRRVNNINEWLPIVIKTTLQGDSLAEYSFNEQYVYTSPTQILKATDDNLILSYRYCPTGCLFESYGATMSMDTLGNMNWTTELALMAARTSNGAVQIDSNLLVTKWFTNAYVLNYESAPPTLFFMDINGQYIGHYVFMNQTMKDIFLLQPIWGHGLVGCGTNFPDLVTQNSTVRSGWLFKMDKNRVLEWERNYQDSAYEGEPYSFYNMIPTSDGGYIAVGALVNRMTGVNESHNWVLKLDSMGCLEPGCGEFNMITKTEEAVFLKGKDIKVFPNPADSYVKVEFPKDFSWNNTTVLLVSNTGITLKAMVANAQITQIPLTDISAGPYYIVVQQGYETITSKRIVVVK
jgi:Secretion system C-terminal sorting domain